jgi:hypothetical protein
VTVSAHSGGPVLEVADILRAHGAAYRATHPVSARQATVMRRLIQCRTAALGGHVDTCNQCGFVRISYNSCRDRHCPKCQTTDRERWIQARLERLLPVEHFHVVFTMPDELNPLALRNQAALYNLLFAAASKTLLALAADAKRLGAQIGFTAILHTWGQNLLFHPHLHCVVTAGGLSDDGQRWVHARPGYLFPVKVLGRLFRGKFLAGLQDLYQTGRLALAGSAAPLADPHTFAALRDRLYRQNWVVYAKPPFAGTDHVFRYLGRYSHRVAIANSRLLNLKDGTVAFRYKDYRQPGRWKVLQLSAEEFIRRFLLHVLPTRFVRIRHYGLLAGRNIHGRLEQARRLLEQAGPSPPIPASTATGADVALIAAAGTGDDADHCPHCHGPLTRTRLDPCVAPPAAGAAGRHRTQPTWDSS